MKKTCSYGTSTSPRFFRPNGISICGYLFLCLSTVFFKYLSVSDPFVYKNVSVEDSWVENITAVWLLLGGVLLFATALMERDTFRHRVYTLGYVALIFAAGEEIGWGQRLFDYPTPQILREINSQRAFSLHNIGPFFMIFNQILRSGTFLLWMIVIAALLCGKKSIFRIPPPSTLLTSGLLTVLYYQYIASPGEYLFIGAGAV